MRIRSRTSSSLSGGSTLHDYKGHAEKVGDHIVCKNKGSEDKTQGDPVMQKRRKEEQKQNSVTNRQTYDRIKRDN